MFSEFEGAVLPHGAARQAVHPTGCCARLWRQRLPRPARDRRPHPPSAREARGEAEEPSLTSPWRGGVPLPGAVRQIFRRSGLRGRLLIALVATSALTLAVAAAALLPPLQDRCAPSASTTSRPRRRPTSRSSSRCSARRCATRPRSPRASAAPSSSSTRRAGRPCSPAHGRARRLTDSIPERVYDTDTASALPANLLYRAIIDGDNVRAVSDNTVTVIAQLFPIPAPGRLTQSHPEYEHFLLITQRPLTDVDAAVDQVRTAFIAAAGIGLIVAVVLGIALSTTLSRRLARLRAAALRVAAGGRRRGRAARPGRDEVGDLARTFAAMQERSDTRRRRAARSSPPRRTSSDAADVTAGDLELWRGTCATAASTRDARSRRTAHRPAAPPRRASRPTARPQPARRRRPHTLTSRSSSASCAARSTRSSSCRRATAASRSASSRRPARAGGRGSRRLARVVRILLDNALRYSPEGEAVRVVPASTACTRRSRSPTAGPGVAARRAGTHLRALPARQRAVRRQAASGSASRSVASWRSGWAAASRSAIRWRARAHGSCSRCASSCRPDRITAASRASPPRRGPQATTPR